MTAQTSSTTAVDRPKSKRKKKAKAAIPYSKRVQGKDYFWVYLSRPVSHSLSSIYRLAADGYDHLLIF